MQVGAKVDEEGVLLVDGDIVAFRRDVGGRFLLDVRRVTIGASGARVRTLGTYVGDDLIDVDEVQPT